MDALTDALEVMAGMRCGVHDCFGGPCDSISIPKCYVTEKYRRDMPDFEMNCCCPCHGEDDGG